MSGSITNVGTGVSTTVIEVVNALLAAFAVTVPVMLSGNVRMGAIRHNLADMSRTRAVLRFDARVAFEGGIRRFLQWAQSEPLENDGYARSLAEMAIRNRHK